MTNRRFFLKNSATVTYAALLRPSFTMSAISQRATAKADLKLSIAGCSFIKLRVEDAITITRKTGTTEISIIDKYIPFNTTKEEALVTIEKI